MFSSSSEKDPTSPQDARERFYKYMLIYVIINVEKNDFENLNKEIKAQLSAAISELAPFQKPKNFLILPDFTPDDGTLTSTLKIRRKNVWSTYGNEINRFLEANGETVES